MMQLLLNNLKFHPFKLKIKFNYVGDMAFIQRYTILDYLKDKVCLSNNRKN